MRESLFSSPQSILPSGPFPYSLSTHSTCRIPPDYQISIFRQLNSIILLAGFNISLFAIIIPFVSIFFPFFGDFFAAFLWLRDDSCRLWTELRLVIAFGKLTVFLSSSPFISVFVWMLQFSGYGQFGTEQVKISTYIAKLHYENTSSKVCFAF